MAQLYSVWHALGVLRSVLVLHSITTFSKSANSKCKEKCYCTPGSALVSYLKFYLWFSSSSKPSFHTSRETWDSLPSSSQVLQLINLYLVLFLFSFFSYLILLDHPTNYYISFCSRKCLWEHYWCSWSKKWWWCYYGVQW